MVRSSFKHISKKNKESTGFFQKIKNFFTASELRLRISMACLMFVFAIGIFSAGFFAVCPVAIALAVAMVYEYDRMFIAPLPSDSNIKGMVPTKEALSYFRKKFAIDSISIIGLLSFFCFSFVKHFDMQFPVIFCFIAFFIILSFSLINKRKHCFLESLPVVYIGLGVLGLLNVYFSFSWAMVLLFFIITISTDSGAFFIGKMIGGPKLCPRISPKKTWSGFLGGIVFALIFSNLFFYISINSQRLLYIFMIHSLYIVPILSIVAQIGDLFESYLKRTAGVKDSSNFIPGHGGFLDRFDSIIFIFDMLIIVWYFYFLLFM